MKLTLTWGLFWNGKSAVTCCENGYTLNGKSPVCLADSLGKIQQQKKIKFSFFYSSYFSIFLQQKN